MAESTQVQATYDAAMRFEVTSTSGHMVTLDGEHQAGYGPMELLLASLAGCSGMRVISILQKKQEDVSHYEMHVRGVMAETHPQGFVGVAVEHIITGHHVRPILVGKAIELAE